MKFYDLLEKPQFYDLNRKIFSFNNKTLLGYVDRLVNAKKGDKILDVGCGIGRYAIFPCEYIGIDPNEDYINYAKKHHQGTFLKMDGADLKFPDNTFDFVVNISTLHHVSDDVTRRMIIEMKRVCKKNGYIYIVDIVYPKNLLGYIFFKLDRGNFQKKFKELKNLLLKDNFQVVTGDIGKTFPYQWSVFSYKK